MNKIKILLITIVLILVAVGVLYGVRSSVQNQPQPKVEIEQPVEVTSVSADYVSETGDEAHVTYYSDNTADLDLIGTEYSQVKFTIATSASGARYENTDLGLVLWEKEPDLTIYKNDESLFTGRKFEVLTEEQIQKFFSQYSWVWDTTIIGNPNSPDEIIYPNKPGVFTLKFYTDKTLSGTTDCNNFSGTYSMDEMGQIDIGPLMSTLMYCEGSQEQEFLESIKGGKITSDAKSLQLYSSSKKTVYFVRGEEIK